MPVNCSLAQQQGLKFCLIISVNKQNEHSFLKPFSSLEIFEIGCWLNLVCECLAFLQIFNTPNLNFCTFTNCVLLCLWVQIAVHSSIKMVFLSFYLSSDYYSLCILFTRELPHKRRTFSWISHQAFLDLGFLSI